MHIAHGNIFRRIQESITRNCRHGQSQPSVQILVKPFSTPNVNLGKITDMSECKKKKSQKSPRKIDTESNKHTFKMNTKVKNS